ncbi:MAG: hypothetical protein OXI11_02235 [Gammaproteobacteria bacterium]|nr:hypothetical protein [Gammaproteobacteria bacterium]
MDDLVVTRFWMLGVIAVMAVFAGIAIVGIARDNKSRRDSTGS